MPPAIRPLITPANRISGVSIQALGALQSLEAHLAAQPQRVAIPPAPPTSAQLYFGFGNTAEAEANCAGCTTWISPFCACRPAALPPSFWPLTNLVGP